MNYNKNDLINQEILQNYQNFIDFSEDRIKKQKKFFNNIWFYNDKQGYIAPNTDFYKTTSEYYITILQKIFTVEQQSKDKKLYCNLFGTITLPSNFHPYTTYKKNKRRKNPNYDFYNISDSIKEGYILLQKIFRVFYKRVKNYTGKDLKYIRVIEPHKSHIPHLHFVLFIDEKYKKDVYKIFFKVMREYKLKQTKLEDNISRSSSYIRKYLVKNFSYKTEKDKRFMKYLDGWKRKHKINIISTSNVGMSKLIYKKLYYSMNEEEKKRIIEKRGDNEGFMKYFIDHSVINTNTYDTISQTFTDKIQKGKDNIEYDIQIFRRKEQKLYENDISYDTERYMIENDLFEELEDIKDECESYFYNVYVVEQIVIKNLITNKIVYDTYEDKFEIKNREYEFYKQSQMVS